MISKFIRLEVCRDIAFGFSFSWLGLRVGGHCWLGLRVGGHCLEWLAVGLSRFLIYLALSPHLIIWSCEAVCPYGSRVCHGLPNRLWVAWVSRFKCRYLDTQLWQWNVHFRKYYHVIYQLSMSHMCAPRLYIQLVIECWINDTKIVLHGRVWEFSRKLFITHIYRLCS